MATLHPFRAVRPSPEAAQQVASVPYDVINTSEARALAAGNPLSFLHVIRPEIDLPEGIDEHEDAVYARGRENLKAFVDAPYTITEEQPSVYIYRLIMNGRSQTGLFACAAVEEYDNDTILKHEKTRKNKEDDRTRHLLEQEAHAEPIMLAYRDSAEIDAMVQSDMETEPLYDFTAPDGIRHTIWRATDSEALVDAFRNVEKLYVADGHHRCKAASRVVEELTARGTLEEHPEARFFPAVFFPFGQMQILPYNRIIKKLPFAAANLRSRLEEVLDPAPTETPMPRGKGEICLYFDGTWLAAALPQPTGSSAVDALDVSRLANGVLEPVFKITDPRTDPNIDFVGGIRGTAELERLVDSGTAAIAISMYPTDIEELVAVSDAGLLMPPKSTWFEPKLRSGLLVHLF